MIGEAADTSVVVVDPEACQECGCFPDEDELAPCSDCGKLMCWACQMSNYGECEACWNACEE